MRRSRIYAIDEFKSTIKSRQNDDPYQKNSSEIQLENPNSPDNMRSKPVYNQNLESYDNFVKTCIEKDELWDLKVQCKKIDSNFACNRWELKEGYKNLWTVCR